MYVHVYAESQNVIELSVTLTQLCHIKCDHVVNFYISLEKGKNCDIFAIVIYLQQYD